jgi:hypothetical protein
MNKSSWIIGVLCLVAFSSTAQNKKYGYLGKQNYVSYQLDIGQHFFWLNSLLGGYSESAEFYTMQFQPNHEFSFHHITDRNTEWNAGIIFSLNSDNQYYKEHFGEYRRIDGSLDQDVLITSISQRKIGGHVRLRNYNKSLWGGSGLAPLHFYGEFGLDYSIVTGDYNMDVTYYGSGWQPSTTTEPSSGNYRIAFLDVNYTYGYQNIIKEKVIIGGSVRIGYPFKVGYEEQNDAKIDNDLLEIHAIEYHQIQNIVKAQFSVGLLL